MTQVNDNATTLREEISSAIASIEDTQVLSVIASMAKSHTLVLADGVVDLSAYRKARLVRALAEYERGEGCTSEELRARLNEIQ